MYKPCSHNSPYSTYVSFVKISFRHAFAENENGIMLSVAAGVQWANGRVNCVTFCMASHNASTVHASLLLR